MNESHKLLMRKGWSSLLLVAQKLTAMQPPTNHHHFSSIMGPSFSASRSTTLATLQVHGRATRQSLRLFQSTSEDDAGGRKKRKAPSTPTAASTRRRVSTKGEVVGSTPDTLTVASFLEKVDRRELQKQAKEHGIKANQKSDVLRAELEAILTTKEQVANTPAPTSKSKSSIPITPDDSVNTVSGIIPKKKKSPKRKSPSKPISKSPPNDWLEIYQLVEELRQDRSAPVDFDGSEALPEKQHGPEIYRFQVLIALMLSSQTKDAVVGETMRKLQEHGLTVQSIRQTPPTKLNELIRKVGFHNNKTKYIKQAAEILSHRYNGDIPPTSEEMMALPGVGPKMAFIVENVVWNKQTGIGIDTHMHRMFNQLRWVNSKNPEQTRMQLEAWLPKDYWPSVNLLWVGFGQEVQQFKPKMLQKALDSSRPKDALKLIHRLGLDYRKEGEKLGLKEEIAAALKN
jgi:endonuclease-3